MDMTSYIIGRKSAGGGGSDITIDDVIAITGELDNLSTTDKSNLVNAINEVASNGGADIIPLNTGDIDFANFKKGVYAFGNTTIMFASISVRCSTFATSQGFKALYSNGIIIVLKDITSDLQNGEPIIMTSGMDNGRPVINILSVDRTTFNGLSEYKIYSDGMVLLAGQQTISGKKTFSTLPETSIAPTTNNQLANKKYVDDAIAAAITTTLGGSY